MCVYVCFTAAHFKQAAMKTETFTNMFRNSPMTKLWIHSAYDPGHCVCCRGGILTLMDPITRFVYNNSADVQLTRQLRRRSVQRAACSVQRAAGQALHKIAVC